MAVFPYLEAVPKELFPICFNSVLVSSLFALLISVIKVSTSFSSVTAVLVLETSFIIAALAEKYVVRLDIACDICAFREEPIFPSPRIAFSDCLNPLTILLNCIFVI